MKSIQSRDNPTFRRLRELSTSSRARKAEGLTLLEGARLVSAFAESGGKANLLVTAESFLRKPEGSRFPEFVSAEQHVTLSDAMFESISGVTTSQGVLVVATVPQPPAWPIEAESVILLEDIQDPGNLGSIVRSAAAAGIRHIGLSAGCVSPWSPKVVRAGMGAHFQLAIHEAADLLATIGLLSMPVIATVPESQDGIYLTDLTGPVAWLFGNEGNGLSAALLATADRRVRIPMARGSESLNVAAAVAVCLFEQVRQRAISSQGHMSVADKSP